jgi:hypothetical protein
MVAMGIRENPKWAIRIVVKFVETHEVPLPGAPTFEVLYHRQVNLYDRVSDSDGWHERHEDVY